tara:strand:+ start:43 stop:387 length:345 start_codon:yes stop_codon:yes gene_type:complete
LKKILKIDDIEGKIYEIDDWKSLQESNLRNHFIKRLNELKEEYTKLIDEISINKLIYDSTVNFTPIIGKKYFLYKDKNEKCFLSLISPTEWNNTHLQFLGTFKQNSTLKWKAIK